MGLSTDIVVRLIQNVQVPLPEVRRRALMESVRCTRDSEQVFDILLDAVSGSPYLLSSQKEELAEAFINGDMEAISQSIAFTTEPTYDDDSDPYFAGTFEMLRLMFTHSRKLLGLPVERRRQIYMAIHQVRTVDQIRHLILDLLPTALSLDRYERQLVANDILDHRYYRLLLPNRLDCIEDLPRIIGEDAAVVQEATTQECPICLEEFEGYSHAQILQCCGQRFCTTCVENWSQQRQSADCPLCRAPTVTTSSRGIHPPATTPAVSSDESFV